MTSAMPDPNAAASVKPRLQGRPLPLQAGTRGSLLALIQTRELIAAVQSFCRDSGVAGCGDQPLVEEHVIRTTGDAVQDRRLAEIGGKGLFAKEIHEALADGRIDCAVHSLKDLETELPPGIVLACTLKREDPREALVLGAGLGDADPADPYACLPIGAVIGSSSVRRQAQLLNARPDLVIGTLRGNVQTRLAKLADGACAATLLAYAGLKRLDIADRAAVVLDPDLMVPSAGQGIIGVTVRDDDTELRELLAAVEDPEAKAVSTAERAMLVELDGSCRAPIGGYARLLAGGEMLLTGLVARSDGSFLLKRSVRGPAADAAAIGAELGRSLRADAPRDILA